MALNIFWTYVFVNIIAVLFLYLFLIRETYEYTAIYENIHDYTFWKRFAHPQKWLCQGDAELVAGVMFLINILLIMLVVLVVIMS